MTNITCALKSWASGTCLRTVEDTRFACEGVQPAIITESVGHNGLSTTVQYIHILLSKKLNAANKIYKMNGN